MTIMTTSRSVDDLPDGFSLEHDAVQPEVWWNIERWLSSGMLPSIVSAKYIDDTSPSHSHASASNTSDTLIHIPIPWQEGSQGRKVAQFGSCKYDYVADVALQCDPTINPIPEYIHQTLLKDVPNGNQYTQCIINKYEAENIIPWHLDHEYFGPEVLVYTFGETRSFLLRKPLNDAARIKDAISNISQPSQRKKSQHNAKSKEEEDGGYSHVQVFPKHCSKYILSGPARTAWEHSVPSGKGERISITFRSWIGPK